MNKYKSYAQIDLPWIERIPSHWKINKVKRYSISKKEINKGNKEKNVLSLTYKGVIKNNLDNPNGLVPKSYETYQKFEKNDLVFKLIDLENIKTSRVGIVHENGIMSPAYIRLEMNKKFFPKYAYYYFYKLYVEEVYNNLGAGVRSTMTVSDLQDILIPIPSYSEQQQIANYLDWKIREIDKLIELEKQKIVELNELELKIIWNYIFNGEKHSEYKKVNSDYINEIPENWHFMKIKRLFRIKKNIAGELGYNVLSITQQGIKVKDISKNEGQMSSDYSKYQIVEIGDFAMNHMDLLTGYIDISNFYGVTSPDYRVFQKISHDVHSKYFLFMFQLFYKLRIFYKYGKGAANEGRWRLSAIEFLNFEVPLPDLDEQKEIVQIIENKQNTVKIKREEINQKIVELTSLKQSLISEVVTGQIDVRNVKIPERK